MVARGRAGGPPPRGPARAVRPAATGVRGVARAAAPVPRGPLRAKGSLPGKVISFDFFFSPIKICFWLFKIIYEKQKENYDYLEYFL